MLTLIRKGLSLIINDGLKETVEIDIDEVCGGCTAIGQCEVWEIKECSERAFEDDGMFESTDEFQERTGSMY